jgi:glycosyltransferase involved in cell wall biosynthesis
VKSIVLITPGFPKNEHDTTCLRPVQCFIKALNRSRPELQVVIFSVQYPYFVSDYQWFGNRVYTLGIRTTNPVFRIWKWIKAIHRIRAITAEMEIIGVLSFWCLETALIGQYFAYTRKLKHRVWIHGQDARRENRFVKLIRPDPGELIALSHFLRDEFALNHGIRPELVIPNAVDTTFSPNADLERTIDVIGVGSLIPLKRYDIFLDVIAELKRSRPQLRAVLIGDGTERDALAKIVDVKGLHDCVSIVGELDHHVVASTMRTARILLHPSGFEGYSTVCLEALQAGCHVVSFTRAENREITHWTVVNDTESMIAACRRILEHEHNFQSVIVHDVANTAASMMQAFSYP